MMHHFSPRRFFKIYSRGRFCRSWTSILQKSMLSIEAETEFIEFLVHMEPAVIIYSHCSWLHLFIWPFWMVHYFSSRIFPKSFCCGRFRRSGISIFEEKIKFFVKITLYFLCFISIYRAYDSSSTYEFCYKLFHDGKILCKY